MGFSCHSHVFIGFCQGTRIQNTRQTQEKEQTHSIPSNTDIAKERKKIVIQVNILYLETEGERGKGCAIINN